MSRSLVVRWEDLRGGSFSSGDRISLFARDDRTGGMVFLNLHVSDAWYEKSTGDGGDFMYREERRLWNDEFFTKSDEATE